MARQDAVLLLSRDPKLEGPRGQGLRVLLNLFDQREAILNGAVGLEESGRFLKKSGAKIFCYAGPWAVSLTTPMAQHNKSFLLLFVHKK